jgi:hypothetical protein
MRGSSVALARLFRPALARVMVLPRQPSCLPFALVAFTSHHNQEDKYLGSLFAC